MSIDTSGSSENEDLTQLKFIEETKKSEKNSQEESTSESFIIQIKKDSKWDEEIANILESMSISNNTKKSHGIYPFFQLSPSYDYQPKLSEHSQFLKKTHFKQIHGELPYYLQYNWFKLLYRMTKHGASLKTFYYCAQGFKNTILVIKDSDGNIFGAFTNEEFRRGDKFYGTMENFVFTFYQKEKILPFHSTGINDNYLYSDDNTIGFGCSDDSFGLSIINGFLEGFSKKTKTYNNCILHGKNEKFVIFDIELWGISS